MIRTLGHPDVRIVSADDVVSELSHAIGVAALPHNMPVEIEAELLLNGE